MEKDGEAHLVTQNRQHAVRAELKHRVLESELAMALDGCGGIQESQWADEVLRLREDAHVREHGPMVAAPEILMAVVLVNGQRTIRVIFYHDPVCERHALVVFVHIGVLVFVALISRHKSDLLLLVAWEDAEFHPRQSQLVELRDHLRGQFDVGSVLLVGAIEAEVEVAHEKIDVCDRVGFNHISFTEEADVFEDALGHAEPLFDRVLARLKMAVDEAEDSVVQGKLDHHAAFPAVAKHVFHDVVLAHVAHVPAIVLLDEDDEEDLAFTHVVYLDVLLAQVIVNQLDFIFLLAAALLPAESYDVVALVVREERLNIDILRLARVVPRHREHVQIHVAQD